jgi:hypothetical protein
MTRTHCTEGWTDSTASLDACRKSCSYKDTIPEPSSPQQVVIPTMLSQSTKHEAMREIRECISEHRSTIKYISVHFPNKPVLLMYAYIFTRISCCRVISTVLQYSVLSLHGINICHNKALPVKVRLTSLWRIRIFSVSFLSYLCHSPQLAIL